ncbi:DUF402 domain-containing protein [Deinococcus lacus]|uniref:DUF402 domain-containing protein n=1 Tax=Deinococcus lacus TaxID=392561 RepID=A0ABW1YDI2_9DEIO
MKHKRFDRRHWARAESGEQRRVDLPGGVLVDYRAGRVPQPLVRPLGPRWLTLLDTGYRWVYWQPHGAGHALTVMLDAAGQPVQLYVDTALDSGLDPDGWPYITDLYLDVLAVCDPHTWTVTELYLKDADELEAAVQSRELPPELAWRAVAEAERVGAALRAGTFAPLDVVREYLTRAP